MFDQLMSFLSSIFSKCVACTTWRLLNTWLNFPPLLLPPILCQIFDLNSRIRPRVRCPYHHFSSFLSCHVSMTLSRVSRKSLIPPFLPCPSLKDSTMEMTDPSNNLSGSKPISIRIRSSRTPVWRVSSESRNHRRWHFTKWNFVELTLITRTSCSQPQGSPMVQRLKRCLHCRHHNPQ